MGKIKYPKLHDIDLCGLYASGVGLSELCTITEASKDSVSRKLRELGIFIKPAKTPKHWRTYKEHQYSAIERKIDFLLTFDEWLKIWEDSGHLHERGQHIGQYCMARFGDKGPYAVGNVKIILTSENTLEGNLGRVLPFESKKKISIKKKGVKIHSEEEKNKIRIRTFQMWEKRKAEGWTHNEDSRRKIGESSKGRIFTDEHRQKISNNMIRIWAERKSK